MDIAKDTPTADTPAAIEPKSATGDPMPAVAAIADVAKITKIAKLDAPSILPPGPEPATLAAPIGEPSPAKPDAAVEVAVAPAAAEPTPAPLSLPGTAPWRIGRIAPLAAVALIGITAGALGSTGYAYLAPLVSGAPATADAPSGPSEIARLHAEIAALKGSVDAASRGTGAQLAKLGERFDRLERAQAASAKSDMVVAKETTGSITPPAPGAAPPLPPAPPQAPSTVMSGWVLRDVYRGAALLQSRAGGVIEVEAGDILPGLGRIQSIHRQDGHWVVVTSKGTITSMR
jgi:hypothetical protein